MYKYTYISIYVRIYLYTHIPGRTCATHCRVRNIRMLTYAYTHTCSSACRDSPPTCRGDWPCLQRTHAYLYLTYLCIHILIFILIHTYLCTRIYSDAHTHTYASACRYNPPKDKKPGRPRNTIHIPVQAKAPAAELEEKSPLKLVSWPRTLPAPWPQRWTASRV